MNEISIKIINVYISCENNANNNMMNIMILFEIFLRDETKRVAKYIYLLNIT